MIAALVIAALVLGLAIGAWIGIILVGAAEESYARQIDRQRGVR